MSAQRRNPPVWVMVLTNTPFGMVGSFAVITLPQILAAQGVPGGHIAAITAVIISPTFWAFIFSPMLDVRFRRRTYALLFGLLTAVTAAYTVYNPSNLLLVEVVMISGQLFSAFYQGAVGGWMGSLISKDQDSLLGTWFTVANVGGGGLMIVVGGPIFLHSPRLFAAVFMFVVLMLPVLLFLFIPAPEPDKLLASESFSRFWREVASLLKRREVLVGLALFMMPSASFALTNVLGGIGGNFNASPNTVSFFAGAGSVIAGVGGSFLVPLLAKKIPLRPLYLAIGFVGAMFTLASLLLPRSPWTFGLVFTGETIFQSLAFTAANGITFEIIGPDNPLAATIFTLLIAASNLPITYMGIVDGWGYDRGGLAGSFFVDAGFSMAACVLLAIILRKWLFASHPVPATEIDTL